MRVTALELAAGHEAHSTRGPPYAQARWLRGLIEKGALACQAEINRYDEQVLLAHKQRWKDALPTRPHCLPCTPLCIAPPTRPHCLSCTPLCILPVPRANPYHSPPLQEQCDPELVRRLIMEAKNSNSHEVCVPVVLGVDKSMTE